MERCSSMVVMMVADCGEGGPFLSRIAISFEEDAYAASFIHEICVVPTSSLPMYRK